MLPFSYRGILKNGEGGSWWLLSLRISETEGFQAQMSFIPKCLFLEKTLHHFTFLFSMLGSYEGKQEEVFLYRRTLSNNPF